MNIWITQTLLPVRSQTPLFTTVTDDSRSELSPAKYGSFDFNYLLAWHSIYFMIRRVRGNRNAVRRFARIRQCSKNSQGAVRSRDRENGPRRDLPRIRVSYAVQTEARRAWPALSSFFVATNPRRTRYIGRMTKRRKFRVLAHLYARLYEHLLYMHTYILYTYCTRVHYTMYQQYYCRDGGPRWRKSSMYRHV